MNTVRKFHYPDGQPRYEVTDDWGCAAFPTAQAAADYIEREHPGETYEWAI